MTSKKSDISNDKNRKDMNKEDNDQSPVSEDSKKMNADDQDDDDDEGYEILPSNDAGITADDNAATGKLHQREGD